MNTLEKVSTRLTNLPSIRVGEDDFVISTALIISCTVPELAQLSRFWSFVLINSNSATYICT